MSGLTPGQEKLVSILRQSNVPEFDVFFMLRFVGDLPTVLSSVQPEDVPIIAGTTLSFWVQRLEDPAFLASTRARKALYSVFYGWGIVANVVDYPKAEPGSREHQIERMTFAINPSVDGNWNRAAALKYVERARAFAASADAEQAFTKEAQLRTSLVLDSVDPSYALMMARIDLQSVLMGWDREDALTEGTDADVLLPDDVRICPLHLHPEGDLSQGTDANPWRSG